MPDWPSMSVDEYAALEQRLGASLCKVNGVWWRRVRPFFYRPLLAFQTYDGRTLKPPGRWPVGFQHAVPEGQDHNSTMNWLLLDQLSEYCLENLSHHRRRLIKRAGRSFQVRPIACVEELQRSGYAAYLSFYQRTHYQYKCERTRKKNFDEWAASIASHPKAILLGGFDGQGLKAVSVSYRIGDKLIYATFFGETAALRQDLGELMFHELRHLASRQRGLSQIIVRSYQGGNDQDNYYLIRGCRRLRKPARMVVSPPLLPMLQVFFPTQFARLVGHV